MKSQNIVIVVALGAALGSGVSGQQSGGTAGRDRPQRGSSTSSGGDRQQSGSSTSSSRKNQQSGNRAVTVTGCLQSGDQSGADGAAATSTSPLSNGGDHFVLANATMGSGSTRTYEVGGNTSDLGQHTNQQVEVTGRILDSSSASWSRSESSTRSGSSSGNPGSSTRSGSSDTQRSGAGNTQRSASSAAASAVSATGAHRLQVESVRMIAASCSR